MLNWHLCFPSMNRIETFPRVLVVIEKKLWTSTSSENWITTVRMWSARLNAYIDSSWKQQRVSSHKHIFSPFFHWISTPRLFKFHVAKTIHNWKKSDYRKRSDIRSQKNISAEFFPSYFCVCIWVCFTCYFRYFQFRELQAPRDESCQRFLPFLHLIQK